MQNINWLRVAIHLCGSRKKLSELARTKQGCITEWLNGTRGISLENAIKIEKAVNAKVTRAQLASGLDKKLKNQLNAECEILKNSKQSPTFKEKVELGLAYEKNLGYRKGARNDLSLSENFPNVGDKSGNFTHPATALKGRTEAIAAEFSGFGNYKTYRQAKQIIQSGIPELIAVVEKELPISRAAKIAQYPPERQRHFLSLDRSSMIKALKEADFECKFSPPAEKGNPATPASTEDPEKNVRLRYEPTAAWALMSFVGLFKSENKRSISNEQNQDSEAGVVSPRAIV